MLEFDASSVLYRQLVGALHSIACDIICEDPGTDNHSARKAWACKILSSNQGPVKGAGCWMWAMLSNHALITNPTTTTDATVKEIAVSFLPVVLERRESNCCFTLSEWLCRQHCEGPSASVSPSASPSASPSTSPSDSPSASPSSSPSISPSASPSASPSQSPSSSPSIAPIPWYLASSYVLTNGVYISGTLDDTYQDDGAELICGEATGLPALNVDFVFGQNESVPTRAVFANFLAWYQGNIAHSVKLQQWNFTTSAWTNVTAAAQDFPSVASQQGYQFRLIDNADYLSGGLIKIRINHSVAGNVNHRFYTNYLYLSEVASPSVSPSISPSASPSESP